MKNTMKKLLSLLLALAMVAGVLAGCGGKETEKGSVYWLNFKPESDEVLQKVCRPVTEFNSRLHTLLDDMTETLVDSGGVGLAAPQVGILKRVVLVDTGDAAFPYVLPNDKQLCLLRFSAQDLPQAE